MLSKSSCQSLDVTVGAFGLPGILNIPDRPSALVVFAHGSGSSRLSSRNRQVADALNQVGLATLLFDLLHPEEERAHRARVFDIRFLANRLMDAVEWSDTAFGDGGRPVGLFGASTGAAAALLAAADMGSAIGAVVSRGGRPDLAGDALDKVRAPTLLIVGGEDRDVIALNRLALAKIKSSSMMEIVPGASHLFPEPGAMEQVTQLATDWFALYLAANPV